MQLNSSNVKTLFANLNLNIIDNPNEMVFIGIRGSSANPYLVTGNSVDIEAKQIVEDEYNCTILQIKNELITAYLGSTLPGRFYTENPENSNGVARLLHGLYSFKRGIHNGHSAFVQNSQMLVLRDLDRDFVLDFGKDILDYGMFGIDLHASSSGSLVQKNSAGCTVIRGDVFNGVPRGWNSKPWTQFHDMGYGSQNSVYKYILLSYDWLNNILTNNYQYYFIGSSGGIVSKIQEKLGLTIDGVYGISTVRSVIQFQKTNGIQCNGYVGPDTIKLLGVV